MVTVARMRKKRFFWLHCTCSQDMTVGKDYLNLPVKSTNPTWHGGTVKETDWCGADIHCVPHFVSHSYCDFWILMSVKWSRPVWESRCGLVGLLRAGFACEQGIQQTIGLPISPLCAPLTAYGSLAPLWGHHGLRGARRPLLAIANSSVLNSASFCHFLQEAAPHWLPCGWGLSEPPHLEDGLLVMLGNWYYLFYCTCLISGKFELSEVKQSVLFIFLSSVSFLL